MEQLVEILNDFNGLVWGIPLIALLLGTGIYLTWRLHFIQFVKFPYIMKETIGRLFSKTESREGSVTPLQALTTALAGTVGTGNIAGVAGAIALGGPGAVFWMWIAALFGMCTKYVEIILAVHFRKRNTKGDFVGGPMYYIQEGLGKNWKWLSVIFCIFGMIVAIGTGNMTQINTIATSVGTVFKAFNPDISSNALTTINFFVGILGALGAGLVLFGGIQRIGNVTEKLVPIMALVYVFAALIVLGTHFNQLGAVFVSIFRGAFNPSAIAGGLVGVTIQQAMKVGMGRGIFSNEAGLGTAPIAHAAADVQHPVEQGMYGVFEVFADTIVICTLTALTILVSGCAESFYGTSVGAELTIMAFSTTFGSQVSSVILTMCITMFAFSTLLSWSLFGSRCSEFLFGEKGLNIYLLVYILFVVIGAVVKLDFVWLIADTMNGLMAIPNLIALLLLAKVAVKLNDEYFKK